MIPSVSVDYIPNAATAKPADKKNRRRAMDYTRRNEFKHPVFGGVRSALLSNRDDCEVIGVHLHGEDGKTRIAHLAINTDVAELCADVTAPSTPIYKKHANLSLTALNAETAQRALSRYGGNQDGIISVYRSTGNSEIDEQARAAHKFLVEDEKFRDGGLSQLELDAIASRLEGVLPLAADWRDETLIAKATADKVHDMARDKIDLERRLLELAVEAADPESFFKKTMLMLQKSPRMAYQLPRRVLEFFAKRVDHVGAGYHPEEGLKVWLGLKTQAEIGSNDNSSDEGDGSRSDGPDVA